VLIPLLIPILVVDFQVQPQTTNTTSATSMGFVRGVRVVRGFKLQTRRTGPLLPATHTRESFVSVSCTSILRTTNTTNTTNKARKCVISCVRALLRFANTAHGSEKESGPAVRDKLQPLRHPFTFSY
jgi:hypothetical protein